MIANRSMPRSTVIPELPYPDVIEATRWLCEVFGFTLRIGMGGHRAQLNVGEGAVVLKELPVSKRHESPDGVETHLIRGEAAHSVMVRVDNIDRLYEHARQRGASILSTPTDYPYGERQYTVQDLAGHQWTFS